MQPLILQTRSEYLAEYNDMQAYRKYAKKHCANRNRITTWQQHKGEPPSDANPGKEIQALPGVFTDKPWAAGIEYRNDEAETTGTRFLDIVLVRPECVQCLQV